jgi:hypothetical protein
MRELSRAWLLKIHELLKFQLHPGLLPLASSAQWAPLSPNTRRSIDILFHSPIRHTDPRADRG